MLLGFEPTAIVGTLNKAVQIKGPVLEARERPFNLQEIEDNLGNFPKKGYMQDEATATLIEGDFCTEAHRIETPITPKNPPTSRPWLWCHEKLAN